MASESALPVPKPSWSKGLTATTDARVAQMGRAKTGKANWARGLTAKTDPRIAKNADSRRGMPRGPSRVRTSARRPVTDVREVLEEYQEADYVYLFGLYLGDGCLARFPRTYRLELFLA